MARKKRNSPEVNAGSMADIAFLLLIFFLVTTTIATDKGLGIQLPPKPDPNDPPPDVRFNERNLFKVLINSRDQMLVEGEPMDDVDQLRGMVRDFVLNNGRDEESSDSPLDAIVSLKTDRGTSYDRYIQVYDELKGGYYDIYSEKLGIPEEMAREPGELEPSEKERYDALRKEIPMQISVAEPSSVGAE